MNIKNISSRASRFLAALGLLAGFTAPVILNQMASAASYTMFSPRSVKMSNSAASATGVAYTFNVTASANAYTVGSFVAQVCTDPFVGATCTAPDVTFNWNSATTTIASQSGITGLTVDTTDSTANVLVLHEATAVSVPASTAISIALSANETNPSTVGTFYMRLYDVANTTGSLTTLQDAGGMALSTTNGSAITINSKVQESLTFCAYTGGSNCAGATYNAVALGDANGILSSDTTDYTAPAYFDVATNSAQTGTSVAVFAHGNTLSSGSNTIAAVGGAGTCVAASTTATTEQFGMSVSTLGTGMSGTNGYACAAGSYEFDTSSGTNLTSVGGEQIAAMTGANAETQNTLTFLGKAATTTKSGIYSTTLNLIAVPTY